MTKINKRFTLDKIKSYFNLKGNRELADFLGVTKQTISNWYTRNSFDYDIIINRCTSIDEDIDLRWLLTDIGDSNKNIDKRITESVSYIEKDSKIRDTFIDLILRENNYKTQAEQTFELYLFIRDLFEYAKEKCLICNLTEMHELLKKEEMSMDDVQSKILALIDSDKRSFEILAPYSREFKALNSMIMLRLYEERDEEIFNKQFGNKS